MQYDAARRAARGHLLSAEDGGYRFWALTPTPDGRVIEGTWSRGRFDMVLAPSDT